MDNFQLRRPGFSLLELLLVITIIGIVASIIVARISTNSELAKVRSCFHNRSEINSAVERWYVHKNSWPAADLSDISADPNYFPSGIPVCPVTDSAYGLNGTTQRVQGHASQASPGDH